jgi:hypothetical protein
VTRSLVKAVFSLGVVLGVGISVSLHKATAHTVDVTEDVAGTWHIEPDHQPKAGESAQVWIALTRQGGELLPFEQTNCSLGLYDMPRNPSDAPILRPQLQPISAEQYQSIPGADVVFPDTGLYQLELNCQPAPGATEFTPFKMQYDVTVASGTSQPSGTAGNTASGTDNSAATNSAATSPIASPPASPPASPSGGSPPASPSGDSPTNSPIASPSTVPIEVPIPGASPANPAPDPAPAAPASALWVQIVGLGLGVIAALLLLGLVGRLFRGKG